MVTFFGWPRLLLAIAHDLGRADREGLHVVDEGDAQDDDHRQLHGQDFLRRSKINLKLHCFEIKRSLLVLLISQTLVGASSLQKMLCALSTHMSYLYRIELSH